MEEKILKYEEIFAKIWGLAMTDCGPENYELFPEMLAQYVRGMHSTKDVEQGKADGDRAKEKL
jgi:hypothetical protein